MAWVKATTFDTLGEKPVVFKHASLQVALFKVGEHVFAIDNRCPHEGYPLAVGTVTPDCVLTCNWHNWKFQLQDGHCIVGNDDVRSYPTRVESNEIWVDLTALPPDEARRRSLRGLKRAFDDRNYGQICREIARLHFYGLDPTDAVREAIVWSHHRMEFGTFDSHAYAGAADWLALGGRFGDDFERRLICYAQAVDHMAFDSLRQPEFPYAAPGRPFERDTFLAAVESEDRATAEGMIARALSDGLHWADLKETFAAAAFAHYNDFGHSAIYIPKTTQLLEAVGVEMERYVLLPLTRQLCYATREDLIPDFKDYRATLRDLPEPRSAGGDTPVLEPPFALSQKQAFDWLKDSLANHGVTVVYDALLAALARNLLHYDTSYGAAFDRPVNDNVSWLDFTHGVTFANASRVICGEYPHLWRPALLQMACFLGRNSHYLDRTLDVSPWRVSNPEGFFEETREQILDHGFRDPIFAVHLLKTSLAVEAELPQASPVAREALLTALNRFLHSPLKLQHVRRLARQAIDLVSRDFRE